MASHKPLQAKRPIQHHKPKAQTPLATSIEHNGGGTAILNNPSSLSASQIMMLQRTIGNQAVLNLMQRQTSPTIQRGFPWRRGSNNTTPATDDKRKNIKSIGNAANPTIEDDNDLLDTTLTEGSEAVGFTSDTFGQVGDTLGSFGGAAKTGKFDAVTKDWLHDNGLPADTKISDLTDDQKDSLEEKQKDKGGLITFGSDDTQENLQIASASAGTLSSGFSSLVGFAAMVNSIKKAYEADNHFDRGDAVLDAIGQGSQGFMSGGQALAGVSQTISTGVAKNGSDAASTAADASGGVMDMFGSIGGVVEMGVSGAKGVLGLIKYFTSIKSKGWGQREQIVQITENFMDTLKGFLSTAKTVMSVVSTFLDIAGKGADFVNAFPVVGAAISIAIQLVDTLVQVVKVVSQVYQMAKSIIRHIKMKEKLEALADNVANADKRRFLSKLVEVNKKRWKRAIIPLSSALTRILANFVSVGASILNIVGAATSVAYGAGVGIMAGGYSLSATAGIMKLGAASMKPIASFTRWSKQKIRDKGSGARGGKVDKFGKFLHINMDDEKTSAGKKKDYQENSSNFLAMLRGLDDWDPADDKVVDDYKELYDMLKATGVNTKELFSITDPNKQAQKIIEALQQRE